MQWKKGIPIEILPQAYESFSKLMKNLTASLPIQLTPNLRMAVLKAGPVVTDNGNFIIDLVPSAPLAPNIISELEKVLERIPGVVGTGLFIKMANAAYFGKEDGSVVNLFAQGPVRNPFAPIKLELEQCLSAEQK
jgi:ribose 5-phosphate isomerase A